jgi:hypothetical protein
MTQMSIVEIFYPLIAERFNASAHPPNSLTRLIHCALLRLIDSRIIIEDNFLPISDKKSLYSEKALQSFNHIKPFAEITTAIIEEGFGRHFQDFVAQVSDILVSICASKAQQDVIQQWASYGYKGIFLMTDAGGPVLNSWLSEAHDSHDGRIRLKIRKIWAINGHHFDYAIVNVKYKNTMAPIPFLIPPEQALKLQKMPIGAKFLNGNVQLGNVDGEAIIYKSDQMTAGGIIGIKILLSLARPRFILCVLSHLLWLSKQNRLTINDKTQEIVYYLQAIATNILVRESWNNQLADEVLALKFVCNELLLDLVINNFVKNLDDQRDLLALSKMEGSSYRCMYELYTKSRI